MNEITKVNQVYSQYENLETNGNRGSHAQEKENILGDFCSFTHGLLMKPRRNTLFVLCNVISVFLNRKKNLPRILISHNKIDFVLLQHEIQLAHWCILIIMLMSTHINPVSCRPVTGLLQKTKLKYGYRQFCKCISCCQSHSKSQTNQKKMSACI